VEDAAAAHALIERTTTVGDEDLRGGREWALSAGDADRFVREVLRWAPGALDRVYLSDATGEPVVLDRTELRVGGRRIDLAAPLEWRASLFQELGAHAVLVCQATWVRQADLEFVLVAPLAADAMQIREPDPALRAAGEDSVVRRALARDVRLMQATIGEPPPRDLRRAIDRAFMLPLRQAFDRAPRGSRPSALAPSRTVTSGPSREKIG
jgi:hypothetical protein